jgi:release factor glutamine methyltransferase
MQINQLIHLIHDQLRNAGVESPIREARLLIHYALGIPYLTLITEATFDISEDQVQHALKWAQRRSLREPLSKIIGHKEFWGLPFDVTLDTLDPRPDSETLIEAVLSYYPDRSYPWKILDLGTGSGCLILSLLHEYPQAQGLAVDHSTKALAIALQNAHKLNLADRLTCQQGFWCNDISLIFDIIISNPPYIALDAPLDPEVKNYDPHEALFAGPDGLQAYRDIAEDISRLMDKNTRLFLEIGVGQDKNVEEIFLRNNITLLDQHLDLAHRTRCLIFCKKNS